ncbi:MAG: stage II sporulation protein M, partial [Bacillota bacterium]|nr:stage II sporulation protein M [Bacillota bacterium]
PLAPAVLFYKGMAVGFTSGLIMESSPGNGVLKCCASLLLQNMIFMTVLGIYCYFTVCMAGGVIKCRNKRFRLKIYGDNLRLLIPVSAAAFVLLCLGAAAEAFINPFLYEIIQAV